MKFLLFLFQLLAISLPCIPRNAAELVYDTEGKELSSKQNYYILPAKRVSGGGLTAIPAIPIGGICMHFVLQERNNTLLGTPLRFTPLPVKKSTEEPIRLSSNIWIEFHDFSSFCVTRLDWHLTNQTLSGRPQQLAAGNQDGGRSFGVFQIEKPGAGVIGYKLLACAGKEACKNLGLYSYKDETWLAVSDEPLMVVFVRKTSY
jgi:hypothetical protein